MFRVNRRPYNLTIIERYIWKYHLHVSYKSSRCRRERVTGLAIDPDRYNFAAKLLLNIWWLIFFIYWSLFLASIIYKTISCFISARFTYIIVKKMTKYKKKTFKIIQGKQTLYLTTLSSYKPKQVILQKYLIICKNINQTHQTNWRPLSHF